MSVFVDGSGDDIREAYEDVRNNNSDTTWALFAYEDGGKNIHHGGSGTDYEDMLSHLGDGDRCYCYARFATGDEVSKLSLFAFITWIGPEVSPLKKAKVSTDKAFVKQICSEFTKEILADEISEVQHDNVLQILETASGSGHGTGK